MRSSYFFHLVLVLLFLFLSPPSFASQQSGLFSDGHQVVIPSNLTVNGVDILSTIFQQQQIIANLTNQIGLLQLQLQVMKNNSNVVAVANGGTGQTAYVKAMYSGSTTSISSTSESIFINPNKVFDSHNAYDTSTGQFTVPVAGTYRLSALAKVSIGTPGGTGVGYILNIRKNGIVMFALDYADIQVNIAQTVSMAGSALLQCAVNDVIDFTVAKDNAGLLTATFSGRNLAAYICIERDSD